MRSRTGGFSITEILVILVIVGIMASIAFGVNYRRTFETQVGLEGLSSLQLIYNAQKRYHLQNGNYYTCSSCTPGEISAALGVLFSTEHFNYNISSTSSGYTANATRKEGLCGGAKMSLTEASSTVTKGCNAWN